MRRRPAANALVLLLVALAAVARADGPARLRELHGHARELGLLAPGGRPVPARQLRRQILAREHDLARALDPRSTADVTRALSDRFRRAQRLKAPPVRVLLGFSRNIDVKVTLSPQLIDRLSVDRKEVARLLGRGPGPGGRWGLLRTPEQLVAALAHHQASGNAKALQVQIDRGLEKALEAELAKGGLETSRAVGGAAAFGANLAAALGLSPAFHSAQTPSPEQAERFAEGVRLVTRRTGPAGAPARAGGDAASPTKRNYIFEAPANLTLQVAGRTIVTPPSHGRVIASTGASYHPTFDARMGRRQLAELARANDLFVAVGLHYLTGYSDAQLARHAERLSRQLGVMREANPRLYVHWQYVRAKDGARERRVFDAIRGKVDSISLNSVELGDLVRNLGATPALSAAEQADVEHPIRIYKLARALYDATGMERVRVHGLRVDVTLVRGGGAARMEREVLGTLRGRQLAVNKVANRGGEIRRARDVFAVVPSLDAKGISAAHDLAEHLAAERGLGAPATLVKRGFVLARDREPSVAFTPTRQFHDVSGGLVSTGDTLDLTQLYMVGDLLRGD